MPPAQVTTTRAHLEAALKHFAAVPHFPAADLRNLQNAKLRIVLQQAMQHVPMYRALYGERGIAIDDIADIDDLWRLPSVEKEDYLRVGPSGYVDERHAIGDLNVRSTSGSLGRGLTIYATREEGVRLRASLWSGWLNGGVTADDRIFMMGSPHLERPMPPYRTAFIPVQMPVENVLERFREFQPTAIVGIVECIAMLARDLRERDVPERHGVRRIFPFGQALSIQLKELIEEGFDAEISNLYGATETSWMAFECEEHDGLHLNVDRSVVQLARVDEPDEPAAPGEMGQIIVTSLVRRTNPFIRYRLSDVGILDPTPCRCGRETPRLRSVEGRVHDFLIATTGRWVAPATIFVSIAYGKKAIVDHRVVQESRDQVRVSIIPGPGFDDTERERVRQLIKNYLGEVAVTIDLVAEIPRDPSGKRRRIFRAFDLDTK